MKSLLALLVTAAFAWGAVPVAAQDDDDSDKKKGPDINEVPNYWRNSEKTPVDVTMKYYWKNPEIQPSGLKAALEKLKAVKNVDLPEKTKTAVVSYLGKCEKLGTLEVAAQNAGFEALVISHAHVLVAIKPLANADVLGAQNAIAKVDGVQWVTTGASALQLHADLEKLTMENLKAAAAKHNCDVVANQTYEYVRLKVVEGDIYEYIAKVDVTKGVMTTREEDSGIVGMWINKAYIRVDRLQKLEGFKIERQ